MIKVLLERVGEYKKWAFLTPLFMFGEVAMEVLIPTIMAQIVDVGISAKDLTYISKLSVFLVLAAFCSLLFGILGAWSAAKAGSGFAANLRADEYRTVMNFSFNDIDKFSTSSLITRMTTDVQNIQNAFQMAIRTSFRSPMMFLFAILMVWRNGGSLALIFVIAIPVLAFCVFMLFSKSRNFFEAAFRKGYDAFNRVVQENLNGIRTVKAYVREEDEEEKLDKASKVIRDNFMKGQKIMALLAPSVMFVSYMCMICLSYVGARLINFGSMETGDLMSIYTYTGQILSSLIMIGMAITMISISRPSAERVTEVLQTTPSMDANPNGLKNVENGSISFKNVNFGYSENSYVLKNINLDIKEGEMIGLIGPTGSGKTTLVSLIARLYDPVSGSVEVSSHDVREYELSAIRNSVSVVLQKNTLFSGTVRENLLWGDENATDEDIKRVADIASVSSFIEPLPDGYDSHTDQGGTNFSGGQRQRLCIARALLKKPKILIMDDSTSAVDTATDAAIRKALKEDVTKLTKIIISQRLSSVVDADRIIIMDEGRIVDVGSHEELMARNEGYLDLWKSQMKGEEDAS